MPRMIAIRKPIGKISPNGMISPGPNKTKAPISNPMAAQCRAINAKATNNAFICLGCDSMLSFEFTLRFANPGRLN